MLKVSPQDMPFCVRGAVFKRCAPYSVYKCIPKIPHTRFTPKFQDRSEDAAQGNIGPDAMHHCTRMWVVSLARASAQMDRSTLQGSAFGVLRRFGASAMDGCVRHAAPLF
jgi:hypothetical protein